MKKIQSVCLLVSSFGGGGAERAMINLANGLSEEGIKVSLLVGSDQGPFRDQVSPNISIHILGKGMLRAIPKIARYLTKHNPEICFATQPHVNIAAILATSLSNSRTKTVIRIATTPSVDYMLNQSKYSKILRLISKGIYKKADAIVSVSEGVKKDSIRFYKLQENRINTIYTPFLNEQFYSLAKEKIKFPMPKDEISICTMGRIMPVKDFCTLIRAFHIVAKEINNAKLYIIGEKRRDLEEFNKLNQLIEELDLEKKVHFTGFLTNPFPLVAHSKIYVLSSLYEGMPGALVQAAALGCKLVSTDCQSGPNEIIVDNRTGYLVPVADYEKMSKAIIKAHQQALNAPDLEAFTERSSISRHIQLFNKLISPKCVASVES